MPSSDQHRQIAHLPSRGVIRVSGPEAKDFLQNLITNDMEKVKDGKAIYAALLTPQGKILFDFFVVGQEDDGYLLDCHGEFASALTKRLSMYRLRAKVEIEDVSDSWHVSAAFGPDAETPESGYADPRLEALGSRAISQDPVTSTNTNEDDYLGFCLVLGVANVALDAGQDKTFLLEANFDELNGVDFTKGCYIGQELAARMKHRARIRKRLLPVEIEGALPEPGTSILAGTREIGSLRSGIGPRAMALIRTDRLEEAGDQPLTANDQPLHVDWPMWLPK